MLTGSRSPIQLIPYDEAYEAGFEDMPRRVPDISKIGALIGYQPRLGLDEIIRTVIEYIQGPLRWPCRPPPCGPAERRCQGRILTEARVPRRACSRRMRP